MSGKSRGEFHPFLIKAIYRQRNSFLPFLRIFVSLRKIKDTPMCTQILCSAIWFDDSIKREDQPVETGFIIGGFRHKNCYDTLNAVIGLPYEEALDEIAQPGFLTNKGDFVGRIEAAKIALTKKAYALWRLMAKALSPAKW
jgi:hypothetical protein